MLICLPMDNLIIDSYIHSSFLLLSKPNFHVTWFHHLLPPYFLPVSGSSLSSDLDVELLIFYTDLNLTFEGPELAKEGRPNKKLGYLNTFTRHLNRTRGHNLACNFERAQAKMIF